MPGDSGGGGGAGPGDGGGDGGGDGSGAGAYHRGGTVKARDRDIPIRAQQGEYVVRRSRAQTWRPLLVALNSGTPKQIQAALRAARVGE